MAGEGKDLLLHTTEKEAIPPTRALDTQRHHQDERNGWGPYGTAAGAGSLEHQSEAMGSLWERGLPGALFPESNLGTGQRAGGMPTPKAQGFKLD